VKRRDMLGGALGAAAGSLLRPRGGIASVPLLPKTADQLPQPTGTPYPLVALPGKAPMGQVYDIPPNYETPTPHLIGTEHYPFTDNAYYYVRYREASPAQIAPDQLRLQVGGEQAEHAIALTLDDLRSLPKVESGAVGQCAGFGDGLFRPVVAGVPWTKGDLSCARWTGASMRSVLEAAGIKPDAKLVTFRPYGTTIARKKGKYVQTYALASMLHPEAMLAYAMNGEDLTLWNGYPLRVIVPGTYAPSWVKQVETIEIRATWDPADWSEGPAGEDRLLTYSLITDPPDGTRVPVGQAVSLRGLAWDAGQGIAKVETSVDGGSSWQPVQIEPPVGPYVWRVWHQTVRVAAKGQFPVLSRATSADGATQALDVDGKNWNASRTFASILLGVRDETINQPRACPPRGCRRADLRWRYVPRFAWRGSPAGRPGTDRRRAPVRDRRPPQGGSGRRRRRRELHPLPHLEANRHPRRIQQGPVGQRSRQDAAVVRRARQRCRRRQDHPLSPDLLQRAASLRR
jgi:sulfite dehydrogenase